MASSDTKSIQTKLRSCVVRRSGHVVLRDVNFEFREGDRIAVLGASGAGKSTLMNTILGYLDPNIWKVDGEVRYCGVDLLKLDPVRWAKLRGRVFRTLFQEPARMVHPMFKVDNQIYKAFKIVMPDVPEDKLNRWIEHIRSELRISHSDETMGAYPHEVSGGQLQRIALSISLGPPARFYFADEPANSLDAEITFEMIKLLRDRLDRGALKGLFMITHDINIAISAGCTKVIFLDDEFTGHFMDLKVFLTDPGFDYGRKWLDTQFKIYESYRKGSLSAPLDSAKRKTLLKVTDFGYRYPIKGIIYRRGKPVIENVNFNLRHGEFIGLAGNSGAGKSTIGRCLGRVQHDFDGEVYFLDMPIGKQRRIAAKVQYLMQDAAGSFDPNQKIIDNLRECSEGRGLAWTETKPEVEGLFERLGLDPDLLERLPNELSGGQRQRIAFIRSILGPTELLIADEPFVNLDPIIQLEMIKILREKREQKPPLSAVIVSHNFGLLAPLCDRIVILGQRRQLEFAKTEELINAPQEEETKALIRAAKKLGQIALEDDAESPYAAFMSEHD